MILAYTAPTFDVSIMGQLIFFSFVGAFTYIYVCTVNDISNPTNDFTDIQISAKIIDYFLLSNKSINQHCYSSKLRKKTCVSQSVPVQNFSLYMAK